MIWWLIILGGVLLILAAMYVPNWVRWARWNRRRKKMGPGEQRDMIAPVRPPFWSSYGGAFYASAGTTDFGSGGAGAIGGDVASDAGFGAGAGFDGGGGDGGGGD